MPPEHSLLDQVLRAPGRKRRGARLVRQNLAEKGHGPIYLMQGNIVDAVDDVVTTPLVARPVGTRHAEPMQHREKYGAFHGKAELPAGKQLIKNRRQTQFTPESLENQRRPYLDSLGGNINLAGENEQGLFREPGQGPDKRFNIALGLKLVQPSDRGDDPLPDLAAAPAVFDNLQILVLPGFLDSSEHGVSFVEDTCKLRLTANEIKEKATSCWHHAFELGKNSIT
jgi:hypothetical protein